MGEESKPVPVLDTGAEGEQVKTNLFLPRHCGLDPQSRGAVTRHAEYLLDTTVAQARTGFKAVSTGWGNNKTTPTTLIPQMSQMLYLRLVFYS